MDEEILQQARNYCAKAERSPRNVRLFLTRHGVTGEDLTDYLHTLRAERYYSPRRYAEGYARTRYRDCSHGPAKIRLALRQQGVPPRIIDEVLPKIMQEEKPDRSLEELLRNKLLTATAKNRQALYEKLMRYGVGRGYAPGEVYTIIRKIISEEPADEENRNDL